MVGADSTKSATILLFSAYARTQKKKRRALICSFSRRDPSRSCGDEVRKNELGIKQDVNLNKRPDIQSVLRIADNDD
jgi:hypothetical protein